MSLQLPADEIIANVLYTLNKTNFSPLLISCETKPAEQHLLLSLNELHPNEGGRIYHHFLASWLESFLSVHKAIHLSDALRVFTSMGTADVDTDLTQDKDITFWIQGLSVLHSIISSEDIILAPHELLRTVIDSYYFRDDDEGDLPTFDSMFVLRSLISAYAIQSAESSTRHSLQYSEKIRWRRLKSMVEDTITLFQQMLCEGFEIVADNLENDTQSTGKDHPIKPAHFITIASWIFTKQIYPACQSLLSLLLEEGHGDGIVNLTDGVVAKLFGMLTTLLALGCTATASTSVVTYCGTDTDRLVFATFNDSDKFFKCTRSYGHPNSRAQESGLTLEDDLLLYDRPHCNKLGLAKIAFVKLQTQLHPSKDAALLSPSPLSAEYRWALSFPRVFAFLAEEDVSHVKLGLYMLEMLIYETPFIRPLQCCTHSTNSALQRAHSSELLAHTLHTLLSLVLRISALEASMPNNFSSELEYSSLQVMSFSQSLLQLYSANVQVQAIAEVSQKLRNSDQGLIALLPKLLDWLRPKIKVAYDNSDSFLLCEVMGVFDPILTGLEEVFDDSTTLPKDIPAFFSMIEAYTSLFSCVRAMKMFIRTDTAPNIIQSKGSVECARLSFISNWLKQSLERFILFKENIEKLIDFWSAGTEISPPPPGWHRCLLLHYHLEDAVLEISGEE